MISRLISRVSILALCGIALLAWSADAPQHKVVKHIALGGDGGWDALTVDSNARRVYVSRANRVMVVDADSGKLVAEIPDTPGVHAIALAPELNKGFISAGRANNVVVVDLKTLKATGTVAAGENPDLILYEPRTKRVFAFNGRSKNVTVIDANSLKVLATIPVSGKPEFAAFAGHAHVFVNIEDKGTVAVIDAKGMKVTSEWAMAGREEPTGLAMDRTVSGRTIALDEKMHLLFIPAAKMKPPAAPGERPTMEPGSFELVVVGR